MESPKSCTFPVQTGGIVYFPWHIYQIEGTDGFSVSSERHMDKQSLMHRAMLECCIQKFEYTAMGVSREGWAYNHDCNPGDSALTL